MQFPLRFSSLICAPPACFSPQTFCLIKIVIAVARSSKAVFMSRDSSPYFSSTFRLILLADAKHKTYQNEEKCVQSTEAKTKNLPKEINEFKEQVVTEWSDKKQMVSE